MMRFPRAGSAALLLLLAAGAARAQTGTPADSARAEMPADTGAPPAR
ncbi:MAG: hypothetical protein ICV87_12640, partial [Gemmatimonadetes bacterium]|nr:hypothetical protein [Gemmatimonadota bacterium]